MILHYLTAILYFLANTLADQLFYLSSNGVTVVCPEAEVSQSGSINGINFAKRRKADITPENADTSCTTGIYDMEGLFSGVDVDFNISSWDTSSVTNMDRMFENAAHFNADISHWDTRNVLSMNGMFEGASSFDQDLSGWTTTNIADQPPKFSEGSALSPWNLPTWANDEQLDVLSIYWLGNDSFFASGSNFKLGGNPPYAKISDGASTFRLATNVYNDTYMEFKDDKLSSEMDFNVELMNSGRVSRHFLARRKALTLIGLSVPIVPCSGGLSGLIEIENMDNMEFSPENLVHFKISQLLVGTSPALYVNETFIAFSTPNFPYPGEYSISVEISKNFIENSLIVNVGPLELISFEIISIIAGQIAGSVSIESHFAGYPGRPILLLNGKNFGFCTVNCSEISVKIGNLVCSIPIKISDTEIACLMPEGTGRNHSIQLLVGNESATLPDSFHFDGPVIYAVDPPQNEWTVGGSVFIHGSRFGTEEAAVEAFMVNPDYETAKCNSLNLLNESLIRIDLPESIENISFWNPMLVISGQKSSPLEIPEIRAADPKNGIDSENGGEIRFYGTLLDSNCSIYIGRKKCHNVRKIDEVSVECFANADVGSNHEVIVLKNGFQRASGILVSFLPPEVNQIYPTRFNGEEDMILDIYGKNFGANADDSVKVLFNDVINGTVFEAKNVIRINSTFIQAKRNELMSPFNYSISVVVAEQESVQKNVTFLNNDFNTNPVADDVESNLDQGASVVVSLSGSDVDAKDSLSFQIITLPVYGDLYRYDGQDTGEKIENLPAKLPGSSSSVLYINNDPNSGESDSFLYRVEDSRGGVSEDVTATIKIRKINRPPEFSQTLIQVNVGVMEEGSFSIPIADFDKNSTLYVRATKPPSRGIWSRTGHQEEVDFQNIVLKPEELLELNFRHDGKGGGNPFDYIEFNAQDEGGLESTNRLIVTFNVTCPAASPGSPEKFNFIWMDRSKCQIACNENDSDCEVCPICKACPEGAQCYRNGSVPTNQPGYYMLGGFTFLPCSPKSACPGGLSRNGTVAFQCSDGYSGSRCGECANGYYRLANICAKCATTKLNAAIIVPVVLGILLLLIGLMFLIRKFDLGFFGIMVTFVQTLAIFQNFKLEWPSSVMWVFNVFSIFNLNIELASPECFLDKKTTSSYETKYYSTMALPLAFLSLVAVVFAFLKLGVKLKSELSLKSTESSVNHEPSPQKLKNAPIMIQKSSELDFSEHAKKDILTVVGKSWNLPPESISFPKESTETLKPTITTSLLAACLLAFKILYLTLAKKSLEIFNCVDDKNGNFYFDAEPSRKCFVEGWWYSLLPSSILGIIFYVVGIPAISLYLSLMRMKVLKKQRFEFTSWDKFIIRVTSKKHREFSEKFDYWDVIIMTRKFLIVVSQLFFASFPGFQAVFVVFVLFLAYVVQRNMMPYSEKSLNFLESSTIVSSILVLMGGLLFFNGVLYNQQLDSLGIILVILIVISTLGLIYMLGKHFFSLYKKYKTSKNDNNENNEELANSDLSKDEDQMIVIMD